MQARTLGIGLSRARIVLAVLGLLSSVYLSYSAAFNVAVACPTMGLLNCESVLSSQYASTFGIPNGYLGVIFFAAVLLLVRMKKPAYLAALNAIGMGFVLYFVRAEYLLGSICVYCTLVHVCTAALLLISLYEIGG